MKYCLCHITLFCLEDRIDAKGTVVYLKLNKQTLSTESFMRHSFPGELTALLKLLSLYSRVGALVNFQVN